LNQQQKGIYMNNIYLKGIFCASALAMAASTAVAQDQPEPFAPATAVTTGRLTTDATSSVMVKVDGSRVIDVTGQPLGRIENIVLSPVGCAEAAILTAANGRLIPIPWTLVRVSGDTRAAGTIPGANLVFTINTEQTRLAQAPSFTRTQWPDMSNQAWLLASVNFFNIGTTNVTATTAVGATGGSTNVVTGAGAQSRIGGTTTTVTNSSGTPLPPTGRPDPNRDPNRPNFEQPQPPPQQQPIPAPPQAPPQNRRVPAQPGTPPVQQPPGTQSQPSGAPPPSAPPPRPQTP
jgi:hypothetical protein